MKRLCILLAALSLAAAVLPISCRPIQPDIPQPKEPELPEEPQEPQNPSLQPVDVVKALTDANLIGYLKSSKVTDLHSGVRVTEIRYNDLSNSPQAVFVMQVDLSDPTVSMTNTVPGGATTGFSGGREKLTAQFKRIDTHDNWVLGGVNTDFFTTEDGPTAGRAQGIFWHNGICLKDTFNSQKTRPRCFVYWNDDEKVTIKSADDYNSVKSSIKLQEAFSGGQFLVRNGERTIFVEDSVFGVHPRTMFGVQKDPQKIILVVLDGRDNTQAVGMNYPDMQTILLSLDCHDAINLDGGGSSTFVVRNMQANIFGYGSKAYFRILNTPSDGSERAIGPGLAILAND